MHNFLQLIKYASSPDSPRRTATHELPTVCLRSLGLLYKVTHMTGQDVLNLNYTIVKKTVIKCECSTKGTPLWYMYSMVPSKKGEWSIWSSVGPVMLGFYVMAQYWQCIEC